MNCMVRIVSMASIIMLCAATMFSSGCATSKALALTSETPIPVLGPDMGLVLLVIETTREKMGCGMNKRLKPIVERLKVGPTRNDEAQLFSVPLEVVSFKEGAVTHLISLSLPAGEYEIERISGSGLVDTWIEGRPWYAMNLGYGGQFDSALNASFVVTAGKVVYGGHVKAHMRQRRSNSEPSAAPDHPYIDQRIAGFYQTTFDITVTDDYVGDINRFVTKFPALQQAEVGKAICERKANSFGQTR